MLPQEREIYWKITDKDAIAQENINHHLEQIIKETHFRGLIILSAEALKDLQDKELINGPLEVNIFEEKNTFLNCFSMNGFTKPIIKACKYGIELGYPVIFCQFLGISEKSYVFLFRYFDFASNLLG